MTLTAIISRREQAKKLDIDLLAIFFMLSCIGGAIALFTITFGNGV